MNIAKRTASFVAIILLIVNSSFAERTPLENVHRYELENGLKVFVVENHAAPLAYIEIAVKAGGIAQTQENAGLFHLYEHMMFKGNAKYRDAASVQRAISDMGVPEWNGTTGAECVNYFFTVPSKLLREGMEFWSYAIREPLLDEAELEREKKVVLAEIEGTLSEPGTVYRYSVQKMLFPKFPWRCDPSGSPDVVRGATVSDIRAIQKTYYVPNNAALFVAGDVMPDEVHALAQELYGSWERSDDPWREGIEAQLNNPLPHVTFCVMPYEQISPQLAQVSVMYRAPDAGFDEKATYAADMLGYFFDDPQSVYVQTMTRIPLLGIPDAQYVWESYLTTRATSTLNFGALLVAALDVHEANVAHGERGGTERAGGEAKGVNSLPPYDLPSRVKLFYETLTEQVVPRVVSNKNTFSKKQFKRVYQKITDNFIEDAETASRVKSNLRFWWTTVSDEYYYGYLDNMMKVTKKDIDNFLTEYVASKNALVTVLVNPAVYEMQKRAFADAGFLLMSAERAFWYNDGEVAQ
ncbi:MAG: insulinase family protein [Treponema sp.]|nr:insulinase family protein [Treponema sp.]